MMIHDKSGFQVLITHLLLQQELSLVQKMDTIHEVGGHGRLWELIMLVLEIDMDPI
jgi:hypothetical protein